MEPMKDIEIVDQEQAKTDNIQCNFLSCLVDRSENTVKPKFFIYIHVDIINYVLLLYSASLLPSPSP